MRHRTKGGRQGAGTPRRPVQVTDRNCFDELTTEERLWGLKAAVLSTGVLMIAAIVGSLGA